MKFDSSISGFPERGEEGNNKGEGCGGNEKPTPQQRRCPHPRITHVSPTYHPPCNTFPIRLRARAQSKDVPRRPPSRRSFAVCKHDGTRRQLFTGEALDVGITDKKVLSIATVIATNIVCAAAVSLPLKIDRRAHKKQYIKLRFSKSFSSIFLNLLSLTSLSKMTVA